MAIERQADLIDLLMEVHNAAHEVVYPYLILPTNQASTGYQFMEYTKDRSTNWHDWDTVNQIQTEKMHRKPPGFFKKGVGGCWQIEGNKKDLRDILKGYKMLTLFGSWLKQPTISSYYFIKTDNLRQWRNVSID